MANSDTGGNEYEPEPTLISSRDEWVAYVARLETGGELSLGEDEPHEYPCLAVTMLEDRGYRTRFLYRRHAEALVNLPEQHRGHTR